MKSTIKEGGDPEEALLRRFLRGELEPAEMEELEERMERIPELAQRLGELARERSEGLQGFTIDRSDERITSVVETRRERASRRRRRLDQPLTLGPVIGEGGMGVVHLGRQHSVDREVAIKTVRTPESPSDLLLEEAYIMGQLEHPNIVPIHDITVADDGRPQVVLKRIEGRGWREVMQEPDEVVKQRHGVSDLLAWHLGIFLQVCQALRFAHSRGIVHRDVKPDNVMIGTFGDVYLLDWGLALNLEPSAAGPTVATEKGIAGTPAYMAPEQLEATPSRVGPHTDTYLLGATLHEIVTGRPPQQGKTLAEIRDQIEARDEVALPPTCPPELAAIIRRALRSDVAERYESVRGLRDAVARFLEHRTSEALADAGDERALALRRAHRRKDEGLAERAFVEGTFSYRMALDAWPDNERAQHGLRDMVERRVNRLLALEAPHAAKRALAVSDEPLPELAAEVEEALAAEEVERAHFAKLKRDDDRRVGHEFRRALAASFGSVWIAGWTYVAQEPPSSTVPLMVGTLVFMALGTALIVRGRREMLSHRTNRQISWLIFVTLTCQVLFLANAPMLSLDMPTALTGLLFIWGFAVGCGVVTVEVRILPTALAYGAGFVLCAADPSRLGWIFPLTAVVIVANMLYINRAIARAASKDG